MRRIVTRLGRARDNGFTLIEAIVALGLAAIIFMALSFALVGGAHQVLLSQQNQQASDVLNRAIEKARAVTYDTLVMQDSDLDTGEATRSPLLSAGNYNPTNDTTSGTAAEPLAHAATGGTLLVPHVGSVTQNGGTYKVRQYVTVPPDTSAAGQVGAAGATGKYRRYTVVVSWKSLGKTHTRISSTIFAYTKSGLPLPSYSFTNGGSSSSCRNPGSYVSYQFVVTNQGARDSYELSNSSGTVTWSYYKDNGGTYDTTQPLSLDSLGYPSTGTVETNASSTFWAVGSIPTSGATPYSFSTTFTVTSAASRSYSQLSQQTSTTNTTVQSTACGTVSTPSPTATPTATSTPTATPTPTPTASVPAQPTTVCTPGLNPVSTQAPNGTMVRYWLYNPSQPGNTASSQDMPVTRDGGTGPTASTLYAYSTDVTTSAGRWLAAPAANRYAGPTYVASWLYNMPQTSTIKGLGELTIWAAPQNASAAAAPTFRVAVEAVSGSTTTTLDTESYSVSSWGCTGFRALSIQLGSGNQFNNVKVQTGSSIRVSVYVTNGVPMVLGYGTSIFPSEFSLPYSAGNG